MSIVVYRAGHGPVKLNRTRVESEEYLQRYIYENPECLPLDEYREDLQLLILAREFPTGSGPIDALGIDQFGELYLIESKLYKNPDKRHVLAQVLDYGASLWRTYGAPDEFVARLQTMVSETTGASLKTRLTEAYGLSQDEADEVIESIRDNVASGKLRFVILMDTLHDRLKDLISFINENARFDVFGVELEFYEHGELQILIPSLYGAEATKSVGSGSGDRRKWDEEKFFRDAAERFSETEIEAVRALYTWAVEHSDDLDWGSGTRRGSFNPKFAHVSPRSVFTVYSDGELMLNFGWLKEPKQASEYAERLLGRLRDEFDEWNLPGAVPETHEAISADRWTVAVDRLTDAFERVLELE